MPPLARVRARFARTARRLVPAPVPDPWAAYQAAVEPALAAVPRLHRFAAVPLVGDAAAAPVPIAVWGADPQALTGSTIAAAALLDGADLAAAAEVAAGAGVDWIALVRPGDVLAPLALERLGQAIALAPELRLLTCDDDALAPDGSRVAPHLRPGPSPDRWLVLDDSGPLLCVRRDALLEAWPRLDGGVAAPGWRHELALRIAGPDGDGHGHVPLLLCHRGSAAEPQLPAQRVAALLAEWGEPEARVEQPRPGLRRIARPLHRRPSVEIVVPFRDKPELLRRCVRSLLAETSYDRYRVQLVDNGSEQPQTQALLEELSRDGRVRVVRDEQPFNYAAINNAAVARSDAEAIVFLNNDTAVITRDWIERLLEQALRPQVGAVAPLLLYPDGTVQHSGAALGIHGYAGHPFAGLAPYTSTPFGRADEGVRNWLAVTAACTLVERAKLDAVGGFDEAFVVAGNDVDLCLRLTAAGQRSLCVADVRMLHDESRSRGGYVDPGDFAASERSYGAFRTIGDPFYNPNLTLARSDCGLRTPEEAIV